MTTMITLPRKVANAEEDRNIIAEGTAHVLITEVEVDGEHLLVRYQVLAHTIAGEAGKKSSVRFPLSGPAAPMILIPLKRLGIVDRGTADDDAIYDADEMVSRELIVTVTNKTLTGKSGPYTISDWPWGATWNVGHPKAPQVPMVRGSNGHAPRPAPAPQPAAAADDGF